MGTHPIFESDFDCLTEARDGNRIQSKMLSQRENHSTTLETLFTQRLDQDFYSSQDNTPWSHTTTVSTGVPGDTVTPVHKSTLPLWSHLLVICGLPTLPMAVNSTNHGEEAILSCTVLLARIYMMNMLRWTNSEECTTKSNNCSN